MSSYPATTQAHYEALLARNYLWMAGGMEENIARNTRFFSGHGIIPDNTVAATDLGAGCGFQTLALARAGFRVTAVDFCRPMLDILSSHTGSTPVHTIQADIMTFRSWAGSGTGLIVCMGDTLTHLENMDAVKGLLRHCARELPDRGKIVISCRDYSREPDGPDTVIPVRQEKNRVFLCRLGYETGHVQVTDILYTRESGTWQRYSGTYTKLRIAPDYLAAMLTDAGFTINTNESDGRTITLIGRKLS